MSLYIQHSVTRTGRRLKKCLIIRTVILQMGGFNSSPGIQYREKLRTFDLHRLWVMFLHNPLLHFYSLLKNQTSPKQIILSSYLQPTYVFHDAVSSDLQRKIGCK